MATVSYIPNDPMAVGGPPVHNVRAAAQPRSSAGFDIQPAADPGVYPSQTPEFDFWQVREALIKGLKLWRAVDGTYPPAWFGGQARLTVLTDAGDDLNAFYLNGEACSSSTTPSTVRGSIRARASTSPCTKKATRYST